MFYLIATTLIGINLFPILAKDINVWNAQGFFVQAMILLMLCWSFKEQSVNKVKNEPLGWFFLWCGASTLWATYWMMVSAGYIYPRILKPEVIPPHFLTFFNILCFVILFRCVAEYLTRDLVIKVIEVFRWLAIGNIIVCGLQYFNLCELFVLLYKTAGRGEYFNNLSGGMLMQPTIMASVFGLSIPIFLYKKNLLNTLCLIFIVFYLCFMSGTSKGDISSGGIVTALATILFDLFFTNRFWFFCLLAGAVIAGGWVFLFTDKDIKKMLLDLNGRQLFWVYYLELFRENPFLGKGLGWVKANFLNTEFPRTMQLHNEPLQIAVELGLVGLTAFVNIVMGVFKLFDRDDAEMLVLHSMLFGFLVSCLHVHLGHIWYSALIGVVCYAGIYALESEKNARFY